MNTVRKVKIITRITIIYINLTSDIFFGATCQQVAPKKISGLKTQKPQRFLGFFMLILKVEFKRYHFPKSTFGEDLN